jgi:TrmH family RNA methyltransferase
MLSKAEIQLIRSLDHKKFRIHNRLFAVEGSKIVSEMLVANPACIHTVYASPAWLDSLPAGSTGNFNYKATSPGEMERISFLKSPQEALALVHLVEPEWKVQEIMTGISLVLDRIQDPGNVGTIIRIAHWFGISTVICSMDTADLYNPKTIQATMGSFMHVKVFYRDLPSLLSEFAATEDFVIYGTFLEGESLYSQALGKKGFVVLGNESTGISPELYSFISRRLMIPSFAGASGPDSLNVAMAAAIICSELRR